MAAGPGSALLIARVDLHTRYAEQVLPGWLVGGAGVGFALPNILSGATADLPPARSATGSAVVNMSRQIGMVLGVSMLVAILGPAGTPGRCADRFRPRLVGHRRGVRGGRGHRVGHDPAENTR
jgi:hypothetical protein